MTTVTEGAASPPPPRSIPGLAAVRFGLEQLGFTARGVRDAVGGEGPLLSDGTRGPVIDRELERTAAPLATLVRLLVLERPQSPDDADPRAVELIDAAGLLVEEGGLLHSLARVVPHNELLIASDTVTTETVDHVAAVHGPSATLANTTVRRRVARAADVATGNGVQALISASHCDHVVATDVNERCLAFAEFNARLNGIDNVEFRAGSFFEPLGGERFDLVVCNPPYVISPESRFVYRDSGMRGDAVSELVVQELPGHLADDGFGTVLISWRIDGDDEFARPASWLAGRGCDAWLLHTRTDDPVSAAVAWNRGIADRASVRERVDAWVAYFEELGIQRIGYGALVVHRRGAADTWFRSETLPPQLPAPSSAQLQRMFAADVTGLLDRPLTLVDGVVADRSAVFEHGRPRFASANVRLDDGLGIGVELDQTAAALLDLLDGRRPLRESLPSDAADALLEYAEQLARHLVERGLAV